MTRGHWTEGEVPDPDNYFGFIYKIDDVTAGKSYIGRKQYWKAKQGVKGCKSKVADRGSPRWKECCWLPSGWESYKGSSKNLKDWMKKYPNHEYRYTILKNCRSRGVLSYMECKYLWDNRVLETVDEDGDYIFFNMQIGAIKFRPKLSHSKETKDKLKSVIRDRSPEDKKKISDRRSEIMQGNKKALGLVHTDSTKQKIGEHFQGEKHHNVTLNESQVLDILSRPLEVGTVLAKEYKVSSSTIYDIRKGRSWKHLTKED